MTRKRNPVNVFAIAMIASITVMTLAGVVALALTGEGC